MNLDTFITYLVTAVGFALSLGYYPQIYKIWKTGSAEGLSVFSYGMFAFGTSVLLAYGFYRQDVVIIGSFLLGALGSWLVLILTLYFRKKK